MLRKKPLHCDLMQRARIKSKLNRVEHLQHHLLEMARGEPRLEGQHFAVPIRGLALEDMLVRRPSSGVRRRQHRPIATNKRSTSAAARRPPAAPQSAAQAAGAARADQRLDHIRFLLRLAELEPIERERRMVERRIKEARFPAVKSLDSFDFAAIPSLNKTLVLELARSEYVTRRENIIAVGNSGTGKTHIGLGLDLAACQKGLSVGFKEFCALLPGVVASGRESLPRPCQCLRIYHR
jgi:IstB-like ATP binding protein